jgi:hypothetical protein
MNPKNIFKKATSPRKDALATWSGTMSKQTVVSRDTQKKSLKKQKRPVLIVSGIYRHTREGT